MLVNEQLVRASMRRAASSKVADQIAATTGERPRTAASPQRGARFSTLLAETSSTIAARTQLERILGGNDLVGISYLERGVRAAKSVCRVHLRNAAGATVGFGTGFLVAPGVLMTNHHVISSAAEAATATAEFNYELDLAGAPRETVEFAVLANPQPIALESLDFCLAGVAEMSRDGRHSLSDFAWLPLDPTPGKAFVGEYLTVIQHPGGERKQVCVRENQLLRYMDQDATIWYRTDTTAGSSGSPVFNGSWQVVALHHSGVPKTDAQGNWMTVDNKIWDASMDESQIAWVANEGIRISRICSYLKTNHTSHPLAQRVLQREAPPHVERASSSSGATSSVVGDELRVTIPVHIAVRVGAEQAKAGSGSSAIAAPPARITAPAPLGIVPADVEAVVVDQSNYSKRPGYSAAFLGTKLRVELPTIPASMRKLVAPVKGSTSGELRYWNYSVVMNKERRLAFYSAVNVDAQQRPKSGGRDGDRWYADTRISQDHQLLQAFYSNQKNVEIDRSKNPFDRGHLTRRLDAQWGKDAAMASRNGNDSFHFTNCSPQHYLYNQGAKRWLGLEDYVISRFAGGKKACVINGPVFDAPRSKRTNNGKFQIQLKGKPSADPTFDDVPIPKMFFKIVACERKDHSLGVAAFLMSQEEFLQTMGDRLRGLEDEALEVLTDAEAKLFQVKVADIEALTGLRFASLSGKDTSIGKETTAAQGGIEIATFDDLRLPEAEADGDSMDA